MAAQTLLEIINASPLSPEDKAHWKELLPKMTDEQKQHLGKTLVRKTEITKSIKSIEAALGVIDEAEREVDDDVALEKAESERDELLDEIKELEKAQPDLKPGTPAPKPPGQSQPPGAPQAPQPPQSPQQPETNNAQALAKDKKQSQARLEDLRGQLKQLSQSVGGNSPPSYKDK